MIGKEASTNIKKYRFGFLPIGCLEYHGEHLNMGHDSIKAHLICCQVANAIGGIVFPPHFYSGIHFLEDDDYNKYVVGLGNLYTDRSAESHLVEIIEQIAQIGIKALILYTGHYPPIQRKMTYDIADKFNSDPNSLVRIIPFNEADQLGHFGHATVFETSFMLYLDRAHTRMTHLDESTVNCDESTTPRNATGEKGAAYVAQIITRIREMLIRVEADLELISH